MPEEKFSPTASAKRVLRTAGTAALGTLTEGGAPFASLVTVATTHAGEPILLISRLAVHTQNLAHDDRASLLLVEPGGEAGDPLAGARLTVTGRVAPPETGPVLRHRFLARHPEAEGYASFADFSFRRLIPDGAHLVAGFGRIFSLKPANVMTNVADAGELIATEPSAVEHMNQDHRESLVLCATRLLHLPPGEWRMTGADPDGIDLSNGTRAARLAFPDRVTTANGLRSMLTELTRAARAAA